MSDTADAAQVAGDEAASLCTACGLCCNGSLFARAMLGPEDTLERFGNLLPYREPAGRGFFPQPCGALCGTRCSIYAERPSVCRGFHCKLLKMVDRDPARLSAAKQTVATTIGLLDQLTHLLVAAGYGDANTSRAGVRSAFRSAVLRASGAKDRNFFLRHGELVELWLKTTVTIRRHFYDKIGASGRPSADMAEAGAGDQAESGPCPE